MLRLFDVKAIKNETGEQVELPTNELAYLGKLLYSFFIYIYNTD